MIVVTEADADAWTAVRISAQWEVARRRIEAESNLRVAEGRLLWLLREGQALSLREIADRLGLEQSTVNRQVNGAVKAGLLERSRPDDCATYLVTSTEHGRTLLETNLGWQLENYTAALGVIPADERAAFLQHLTAFVGRLASVYE